MSNAFLIDMSGHVLVGGMFTCTVGVCKRYCHHRMKRWALTAIFLVAEAAITVPLIG
jgi:hypothetical protein